MGGDLGVERWSKNEKGLMDMDNSVVIAGGEGYINGNGRSSIKIKKKDIRPSLWR